MFHDFLVHLFRTFQLRTKVSWNMNIFHETSPTTTGFTLKDNLNATKVTGLSIPILVWTCLLYWCWHVVQRMNLHHTHEVLWLSDLIWDWNDHWSHLISWSDQTWLCSPMLQRVSTLEHLGNHDLNVRRCLVAGVSRNVRQKTRERYMPQNDGSANAYIYLCRDRFLSMQNNMWFALIAWLLFLCDISNQGFRRCFDRTRAVRVWLYVLQVSLTRTGFTRNCFETTWNSNTFVKILAWIFRL